MNHLEWHRRNLYENILRRSLIYVLTVKSLLKTSSFIPHPLKICVNNISWWSYSRVWWQTSWIINALSVIDLFPEISIKIKIFIWLGISVLLKLFWDHRQNLAQLSNLKWYSRIRSVPLTCNVYVVVDTDKILQILVLPTKFQSIIIHAFPL